VFLRTVAILLESEELVDRGFKREEDVGFER